MALLLNLVAGPLLKPLVALFKILGAWGAGNRQGRTSERLRAAKEQEKHAVKARQASDRVSRDLNNPDSAQRLRDKWTRRR